MTITTTTTANPGRDTKRDRRARRNGGSEPVPPPL